MKLFGLNITRSSAPTTLNPELSTRSLATAWLRGDDLEQTGPVLTNAYQQVAWVYRAINALADQVSNIPFLFSRGQAGRETLITSGPLLDFYNRPHRHLNQFQYWEFRVMWLMLRGECFRIPIYNDSFSASSSLSGSQQSTLNSQPRRIRSVVFVDPAQMQHIIEDHELVGWRYTGSGKMSPLESQVFLPHEVWFEKLPNPFDFWRGLAPLYAATMPAQTDFAAASFMRGFIENNADLGLVVRTDQPLSEEQRTQILASLKARKRRAGTADRPIVLSGGAQIIKPEISSADLQFLENRKFSRAEICAAFGVPEEIITATDHAKYDVMQGARLNFIENRVIPLCARLQAEEAVTVRAIDPTAVGWFDTDSLPIMQDARRNRLNTAKIGFDMGIPFNELNRIFDLGFKDLPWGDTGYVPSNVLPAGILPKP
jgi:HK97 family phage portal protein